MPQNVHSSSIAGYLVGIFLTSIFRVQSKYFLGKDVSVPIGKIVRHLRLALRSEYPVHSCLPTLGVVVRQRTTNTALIIVEASWDKKMRYFNCVNGIHTYFCTAIFSAVRSTEQEYLSKSTSNWQFFTYVKVKSRLEKFYLSKSEKSNGL